MTTIIAIIILPMILAALLSYSQILYLAKSNIKSSFFFILGFVIYLAIHFKNTLSRKINYAYVFSHEMTHAFFGILTGNRVKKINVGAKSGYVSFSGKVNIITAISPYIFPFYNIIISLIYIIVTHFTKRDFFEILLIFEGFFLSFHIMNTIDALSLNQKDFKESGGRFTSSIFIITANILITALIINLLISNDRQTIYNFIKNCFSYYIFILKKLLSFIYFIFTEIKKTIK